MSINFLFKGAVCVAVAFASTYVVFFGWFHGTVHELVKAQKHMNSVRDLSFIKYFVTVFSAISFQFLANKWYLYTH